MLDARESSARLDPTFASREEEVIRAINVASIAVGVMIFMISLAFAGAPPLATESYRIESADPGIELYIRNKHPSDVTAFAGD
jgi:hypothetical protein